MGGGLLLPSAVVEDTDGNKEEEEEEGEGEERLVCGRERGEDEE